MITVLDSETSGIVFIGAPYSFYTVDGVPVNYTVGAVTAFDLQAGGIANITYDIVSANFSRKQTLCQSPSKRRTDGQRDVSPSVRPSVRPSLRWSLTLDPSFHLARHSKARLVLYCPVESCSEHAKHHFFLYCPP